MLTKEQGIIVAADVPNVESLRRLITICEAEQSVVAIKVGVSLALRYGLGEVVRGIREVTELPVIYDHQKAGTDIPASGRPFAEVCADAGVEGVIFFPLAGPNTLESFVLAAFDLELTPIVGLVMTHAAFLESEGGFISDDASDRILEHALKLGVNDFVMPGNRLDALKSLSKKLKTRSKSVGIMMPGIGTQGGTIKAAFAATDTHRHYAIIGSSIYAAADPSAALSGFVEEVES